MRFFLTLNMKTIKASDKDFICDIEAPCFSTLDPEEVNLIRNSKTQVIFHKGETMIKQGAFSSYILFINDGISKQYIEEEGSRNLNLHLFSPGEFAGLTAVFADRKFNYSVTALSDTRVFLIETDAVSKLIQQNATFSFKITKRYWLSNSGLFENIHRLYYKQLNGRMANILLYIDGFKTVHPEIFSLLTRKDLAEFAGMSTESAVKILKSFEKDRLIKLAEKNISIIRPDKMLAISRTG